MKLLKWCILTMYLGFSSGLWAQSEPVPQLEKAANQIINALQKNKAQLKNNPKLIHQTVETYLLPHVDIAGMSRSVLGREQWNKATAAEKSEFAKSFTQLIIRTYSSPLAQYTDEKVKFFPVRDASNARFLRVNSMIMRSSGQNIPLSYSLIAKDGSWKIYDMSVEGVSLLQSFKQQFAQALQQSSMQALILQMQNTKKAS